MKKVALHIILITYLKRFKRRVVPEKNSRCNKRCFKIALKKVNLKIQTKNLYYLINNFLYALKF